MKSYFEGKIFARKDEEVEYMVEDRFDEFDGFLYMKGSETIFSEKFIDTEKTLLRNKSIFFLIFEFFLLS